MQFKIYKSLERQGFIKEFLYLSVLICGRIHAPLFLVFLTLSAATNLEVSRLMWRQSC